MHNNQLPAKTLFKLNDISSGYVRMLMISSTLGFETNQVCMSYLEVATISSFYHWLIMSASASTGNISHAKRKLEEQLQNLDYKKV